MRLRRRAHAAAAKRALTYGSLFQLTRSVAPERLTTACTALEYWRLSSCPSSPSAGTVSPSSSARFPPDEKPTTPMRAGSMSYCAGICPEKPYGALYVMDLRREDPDRSAVGVLYRRTVVHGDSDISLLIGQIQGVPESFPVQSPVVSPTVAAKKHDCWLRNAYRLRSLNVHLKFSATYDLIGTPYVSTKVCACRDAIETDRMIDMPTMLTFMDLSFS